MLALLCFGVFYAHSVAGGTVALDLHRQVRVNASLAKPGTSKVAYADPDISVGNHGTWYGVTLELGTPPQKATVQIDTGSSDLWIPAPFNPQLSSTFKANLSDPFRITYGDGSGAQGYYAEDTLQLSNSVAVQGANFAYAETATSDPPVFGIGYVGNEAGAHYANIPVQLKQQGFISALAYSLYLGESAASSATGQVLFGGVDHSKYDGQLYTVPITQPQAFFVSLDGIYHNNSAVYSTPQQVLLDSGTTELILHIDMVTAIVRAIDPKALDLYVGASVQCSLLAASRDALEFDFSGARISVPVQNLVDPDSLNADGTLPTSGECRLGVQATFGYPYILGDRFLIGAYVVYDLENHEVSLANAAQHPRDSQVEAIEGSVPQAVDAPKYTRASNHANSTSSTSSTSSPTSPQQSPASSLTGTFNTSISANTTADVVSSTGAAPPAVAAPPFALPFAPAAAPNATRSGAGGALTAGPPRLAKAQNNAARRGGARLNMLGAILLLLA